MIQELHIHDRFSGLDGDTSLSDFDRFDVRDELSFVGFREAIAYRIPGERGYDRWICGMGSEIEVHK